MKIFRELTFEGTPENLLGFLDSIELALCDGWRRDEQWEARILGRDPDSHRTFRDRAYYSPQSDLHAAARLWIMARNEGSLYVSNVIPAEQNQFSHDAYNAIVKEFHDRFTVGPAANHEIAITLGPDQVFLEDMIPVRVFEKLVGFTLTANPYTGSDLPNDRERWQNFIIESHESDCHLPGEVLRRWLVEDKHWSEDIAAELVSEYEFGRSLLAHEHAATA